MAITNKTSTTLVDELAALDPAGRRELAAALRGVAETLAEVSDAKTTSQVLASWLTCSTRPDPLVDLYRIWSVPGQASVPSTQLCFPTTCCPESISR